MKQIQYDDIALPTKVSDILRHDFWMLQHVSNLMIQAVHDPVKFSAYTSIFVLKGEATVDINLLPYTIKGPCLVNVRADAIMMPRRISEDFDASFAVLSTRMHEAMVNAINEPELLNTISRNPVVHLTEQQGFFMEKLYHTLSEIQTSHQNTKYAYKTMLYTLVAFFFRYCIPAFDNIKSDKGEPFTHNYITDQFIRLVQENFKKERFLDFYADQLQITPKHLSRTVKTQTGISATDWIARYVILEAKVLLRSTNLNVQQIAEELNFPNQSFFGKYFKKATGISPKDYRNAL